MSSGVAAWTTKWSCCLDDKEIIRTVDRASEEPFDGFTIINGGGDYAFSRITIFGTLR